MTFMKEGCPFRRGFTWWPSPPVQGRCGAVPNEQHPNNLSNFPRGCTEPEIKVRLFDLDEFLVM